MNKKMKWIVIAVLAAVLLTAGAYALTHMVVTESDQPADTEEMVVTEEAEIYELSGEVTQVTEDYFVIMDAMHGEVQVNFGDDTLFEGIEAGEVVQGQYVLVLYDGKMTRSLPAQVYALRVGVYAVTGEVKELGEGSMTLVREEIGDEVIVFLPEGAPQIAVGDVVTAYTNGAMTMSLPAQTTALSVAVH